MNPESQSNQPKKHTKPSQTTAVHAGAAVQIIHSAEMHDCNFWIGLFHKGKIAPTELWSQDSVYALFEQAASSGIAEAGPLMLSDSVKVPARFVYLLPEPPSAPKRTEWIAQIIDTLRTWSPERVGVYISPAMMDSAQCRQLLMEIIGSLVQESNIKEYFVMPGKFGTNSILNALLQLRDELRAQGSELKVFH
jgi:hypothetical protein